MKLFSVISVFGLLFAPAVAIPDVDQSGRIETTALRSGIKEESEILPTHSNIRESRNLQAFDLGGFLGAILEAIPSIAQTVLSQVSNVVITVFENPSNFFSVLEEFVVNIAAEVVTTVVNIVAASSEDLISGFISDLLASGDPTDLGYTVEATDLYTSGVCTVTYAVDSTELSGFSTSSISGFKLDGFELEDSVLSAGLEGQLEFEQLSFKFTGAYASSPSECTIKGTYESTATLTNPSLAFDFFLNALVENDETTNTDALNITTLEFDSISVAGFEYEFSTTTTTSDFDTTTLEGKLAEFIDNIEAEIQTAASNSTGLLDTLGVELPIYFDVGADIPLI